jgi:hypothetical protein
LALVIYLNGAVRSDLPSDLGLMMTPMMGNRLLPYRPWGADTGCFNQPDKHDDDDYLWWLDGRSRNRCLFATAPGVVGDAERTIERSLPMFSRIRDLGYPAALVGQDGMTPSTVPWSEIDAFFIGGTTEWKLGPHARRLAAVANRRGKLVHTGRVNSKKRLQYAADIGCFSADGTYIAFGPAKNAPKVAQWVREVNESRGYLDGLNYRSGRA